MMCAAAAACDATNYLTEIGRNKKARVDKTGLIQFFFKYRTDWANANVTVIIITSRIKYYFSDYHTTSSRVGIHYSMSFVSTIYYTRIGHIYTYKLFTYISLFIIIPHE